MLLLLKLYHVRQLNVLHSKQKNSQLKWFKVYVKCVHWNTWWNAFNLANIYYLPLLWYFLTCHFVIVVLWMDQLRQPSPVWDNLRRQLGGCGQGEHHECWGGLHGRRQDHRQCPDYVQVKYRHANSKWLIPSVDVVCTSWIFKSWTRIPLDLSSSSHLRCWRVNAGFSEFAECWVS